MCTDGHWKDLALYVKQTLRFARLQHIPSYRMIWPHFWECFSFFWHIASIGRIKNYRFRNDVCVKMKPYVINLIRYNNIIIPIKNHHAAWFGETIIYTTKCLYRPDLKIVLHNNDSKSDPKNSPSRHSRNFSRNNSNCSANIITLLIYVYTWANWNTHTLHSTPRIKIRRNHFF